jgi:hypothetical protein
VAGGTQDGARRVVGIGLPDRLVAALAVAGIDAAAAADASADLVVWTPSQQSSEAIGAG